MKKLQLSNLKAKEVFEEVQKARKQSHGDFTASGYQILALDANGERITDDPIYYGKTFYPSLTLLKNLAKEFYSVGVIELIIEGMAYNLSGYGRLFEQRRDAEPTGDWWQVDVVV